MPAPANAAGRRRTSLHWLGVISGLAAGAGLGAAEAPTKLVTIGLSPFMVSLGMVAGVFVARWTVPMVLKGSDYVWADLREKPHLVVWALMAGMLWAVANTLTVFAIRDVGLSVAFPLWNTNSLVGLFWGWLLFNELRGAGTRAVGQGAGRGRRHRRGRLPDRAGDRSPGGRRGRTRALGIAAALGAGPALGHDVHPLPQGLHQRHEPAVVRHGLHRSANSGRSLALALVFEGGCTALMAALSDGAAGAVLAVPGRVLLGHRRSVPAVRGQVHRHRPRHSRCRTPISCGAWPGACSSSASSPVSAERAG